MEKNKLSYQEVAETMSELVVDVNVISEKDSEIVVGSLENILQVCEMYEKSKYVVRKNKI